MRSSTIEALTEDAHTPFGIGRENHRYTLSDFTIRVWWSGCATRASICVRKSQRDSPVPQKAFKSLLVSVLLV
jgi:hypothetical protein